jgi:hypothetical protein
VKKASNIPKNMKPLAITPLDHTKSKTNPKPRKPPKNVANYEGF